MSEQKPYDVSVLYVEDETVTREEIAQFLGRRIRDLFIAANGEEGLGMYDQKNPDLIVTDIRMPIMDGLAMCRTIRDRNKGIPIIVTSAYSDTAYMLDAIDIGVDQYVVKPVDMNKLTAALEKCVEIIEYRRAHKKFLAEREKLIADLQKALAEIRTLQGILPICSSCKRIRNEEGAWTQLEWYIREHTHAEFSHGLCQECAKKLYPKYYQEGDRDDTGT